MAGASILRGLGGLRPPDFGWGSQGVVKYYYCLFFTGSRCERGQFSREIETFAQNVAGNAHFLWKTTILE